LVSGATLGSTFATKGWRSDDELALAPLIHDLAQTAEHRFWLFLGDGADGDPQAGDGSRVHDRRGGRRDAWFSPPCARTSRAMKTVHEWDEGNSLGPFVVF
jgi:hypothetical protein